MRADAPEPKSIDEYVAAFPPGVRKLLEDVRRAIQEAAPGAGEAIKYRMPTFTLNGNLVHFAACARHVGFYPAPSAIEKFRKELSAWKGAKGSVQFPLDEPMPLALIGRIVRFRVKEQLERARRERKAKPTASKR
ncbi:MAG: DUF1801 domain-containing protein [Holophagales bacterium]|jgi:uncharacterized protein YdhG (YjbR/CyaY superfamily)|nr:DUF1801 domain-containing protein [Holophagales bacterium]MBK9965589.1 DUF1801 domain-containing protein [Holophagales bacterium]